MYMCSQETAQLEAEIFTKRQQVAMAAELKQVLDSWVRYEQQAKESEQAELAKTVIERALKTLQDEKSQKDVLLGAITELEREYTRWPSFTCYLSFPPTELVKNKAI
jgi:F-type H+-transporting ATPase subunit b